MAGHHADLIRPSMDLIVMHLAIALITYNLLVRLAPAGLARREAGAEPKSLSGVDFR
jgi:hypothetical protein